MNKAVFLDRDGVLNQAVVRDGKPYAIANADEILLADGAEAALRRLKEAGFLLIVVTNQPEVARGSISRSSVEAIHASLGSALPIDDVFTCYHDDSENCACRKPRPGLLLEAAARHDLHLASSYLVGDRWRDIDAAHAAGCVAVLIDHGYKERSSEKPPAASVRTIEEAADWILNRESDSVRMSKDH
jgi:D-glycero-D-manno-heptose 1,7-bisphosphate phosphatase